MKERQRLRRRSASIWLVTVALAASLIGVLGAKEANAAPHGCASVSNDYSLDFDASSRSLRARVNIAAAPAPSRKDINVPCTFIFATGDTFSGSGAFKVTCKTGGQFVHPDFQDGRYPPVLGIPIPQPCKVGAPVTIDGGHFGSGGGVIAGSGL